MPDQAAGKLPRRRRPTGVLLLVLGATLCGAPAQTGDLTTPASAGATIASQYRNWSRDATAPVMSPGVHAVPLLASTVTIGDGGVMQPTNLNAPLALDDPQGGETSALKSESCHLDQSPCTITADFARTHPGRSSIRSATDGLQEAIDSVGPAGGALAIIPDWAGRTGHIPAAKGAPAIALADLRGGAIARHVWNGSAYQMAASQDVGGASSLRQLNQIRYADAYCAVPGVFDETCINNAVLSLDDGGPQFSGTGRVYVPPHAYVVHHPVVLHRGIDLEMDSRGGGVIEGDGAHVFTSGIVRFCANPACSTTPPTPGEADVRLVNLHIRVADAGDVGLNAYGLTDSTVTNLLVDSTNDGSSGFFGTGLLLGGGGGTSDYRNTLVNAAVRDVAVGAVLGSTGAANANVFLGGSLQGDPALEIVSGSANDFFGTVFNGVNAPSDTLVALDAAADHNLFIGNYYDDGLGPGACPGGPCAATGILIAAGAQGNAFQGAHFDPEGGTMSGLDDHGQGTDFYALGPITGSPASENDRIFAGGGGNVFFSAPTGPSTHYGFGNETTPPNLAYGFTVSGTAPLADGMELNNTAAANSSNAVEEDFFLTNGAGAKTLYGDWQIASSGTTPGSESAAITLQCRASGSLGACLRFHGMNGFLGGTLAPAAAAGAGLGTSALPFAGWCIGNSAGDAACSQGTFTAARTVFIPDANSATAQSAPPAAHQFLTGFDASTGSFVEAQPAAQDLLNGTATGAGATAPDAVVLNSAMPLATTVTLGGGGFTLSPQSCTDVAESVTAAAPTMAVALSPAGPLASGWPGVQWSGYVDADGQVQVHLCNPGASAATLAVQALNLRLIQ